MNSRRGFTLVELLGAIVILALLSLIAIPVVTNSVKKNKEKLYDIQIKNIESAAKAWGSDNLNLLPDEGEYITISLSELQESGYVDKDIKNPKTGEALEDFSITICNVDNQYTYKKDGKCEVPTWSLKTNGEVVYFDVDTGKKCTNYTEAQSNTGVKSGCMKFYAFNDDGGDKLNLILDHNTTATIAWNSSGSNKNVPNELLSQLKADTSSWKGTLIQKNYTIDQSTQTSGAKYTIDYSGYKARIITAQEIAQITGNTSWDETLSSSNYFNFDTNTFSQSETCQEGNTTGCKYGWLYDRTSTSCTTYGCLNNSDVSNFGYWTATPYASNSNYAWHVDYGGRLNGNAVDNSVSYGVRPVITVLKSKLQ